MRTHLEYLSWFIFIIQTFLFQKLNYANCSTCALCITSIISFPKLNGTLSVSPGAIDHWQPKHCSSCELGWEKLQGLHTSLSRGEMNWRLLCTPCICGCLENWSISAASYSRPENPLDKWRGVKLYLMSSSLTRLSEFALSSICLKIHCLDFIHKKMWTI